MTITQPGSRLRQEVRYGATAQTLEFWVEIDGLKVDPSSATVAIYAPDSDISTATALVASAAATESADNLLSTSVDVSSTSTFPLAQGYIAAWSFTASSRTHVREMLFDVVRRPFNHYPPLRDDDLKNAHVSVDPALTQLNVTAQRFILQAWEDFVHLVRGKGKRLALITDPADLAAPFRHFALDALFRGVSRKDDHYWRMAEDHRAKFATLWDATELEYSHADIGASHRERGFAQPQLLIGNDLRNAGVARWRRLP